MRRMTWLLALFIGTLAPSPIAHQIAAQESSVKEIVAQRVRAYFAAMGSGKIAVIEQALAEDYLVIGGDGKLETRRERLAWLRTNAKNLFAVTPREILVRTYGATAIATGLVVIPQEANAPPIEERFTQVWLYRGGIWKMVSGQITIVKK